MLEPNSGGIFGTLFSPQLIITQRHISRILLF